VIGRTSLAEFPLAARLSSRGVGARALPDAEAEPAVSSPALRMKSTLSRAEITALIEREYVGLRLLIARRARDLHVAEDLLNEAVCTTWTKWEAGKIEQPDQIAGYIFQVAMNLLRNHRRAMGSRADKRAGEREIDGLPGGSEPRDDASRKQIAARVRMLVKSIGSERDRRALVRFYLDEEDKETICKELNLSPLQFDKVLHRARRRLRELLESQGLGRSDFLSVLMLM